MSFDVLVSLEIRKEEELSPSTDLYTTVLGSLWKLLELLSFLVEVPEEQRAEENAPILSSSPDLDGVPLS